MHNKLRVLIIIGLVEVAALALFSGTKNNTVSLLGYEGFKLGNRTILLKAPPKMQLITNSEEIKRKLHMDGDYAFAFTNDSSAPKMTTVAGDYFLAGENDDFPKLLAFIERDTTAKIVTKTMTENELSLVFSLRGTQYDSSFYLFQRYTKCYPYYLRVVSGWLGTETVPPFVVEALTGIEVRK